MFGDNLKVNSIDYTFSKKDVENSMSIDAGLSEKETASIVDALIEKTSFPLNGNIKSLINIFCNLVQDHDTISLIKEDVGEEFEVGQILASMLMIFTSRIIAEKMGNKISANKEQKQKLLNLMYNSFYAKHTSNIFDIIKNGNTPSNLHRGGFILQIEIFMKTLMENTDEVLNAINTQDAINNTLKLKKFSDFKIPDKDINILYNNVISDKSISCGKVVIQFLKNQVDSDFLKEKENRITIISILNAIESLPDRQILTDNEIVSKIHSLEPNSKTISKIGKAANSNINIKKIVIYENMDIIPNIQLNYPQCYDKPSNEPLKYKLKYEGKRDSKCGDTFARLSFLETIVSNLEKRGYDMTNVNILEPNPNPKSKSEIIFNRLIKNEKLSEKFREKMDKFQNKSLLEREAIFLPEFVKLSNDADYSMEINEDSGLASVKVVGHDPNSNNPNDWHVIFDSAEREAIKYYKKIKKEAKEEKSKITSQQQNLAQHERESEDEENDDLPPLNQNTSNRMSRRDDNNSSSYQRSQSAQPVSYTQLYTNNNLHIDTPGPVNINRYDDEDRKKREKSEARRDYKKNQIFLRMRSTSRSGMSEQLMRERQLKQKIEKEFFVNKIEIGQNTASAVREQVVACLPKSLDDKDIEKIIDSLENGKIGNGPKSDESVVRLDDNMGFWIGLSGHRWVAATYQKAEDVDVLFVGSRIETTDGGTGKPEQITKRTSLTNDSENEWRRTKNKDLEEYIKIANKASKAKL